MKTLYFLGYFFSVFMLCVGAVGSPAQQNTGVILGSVIDEHGTPVAGAEVDADTVGPDSRSKALRLALTDSRGAFRFDPVRFGTYNLYALKPDAGYPDTKFELYASQHHDVRVTVFAAAPQAEVRILVGPKSGILKLAVLDKATRQQILNPTIILRQVDTGVWISTTYAGDSNILLPPLIPIQVTVQASGYRDWSRGDPKRPDSGSPFRIGSGEELEEKVLLEPASGR